MMLQTTRTALLRASLKPNDNSNVKTTYRQVKYQVNRRPGAGLLAGMAPADPRWTLAWYKPSGSRSRALSPCGNMAR